MLELSASAFMAFLESRQSLVGLCVSLSPLGMSTGLLPVATTVALRTFRPANVRRILCVFPAYTKTFGTFDHAFPLMGAASRRSCHRRGFSSSPPSCHDPCALLNPRSCLTSLFLACPTPGPRVQGVQRPRGTARRSSIQLVLSSLIFSFPLLEMILKVRNRKMVLAFRSSTGRAALFVLTRGP